MTSFVSSSAKRAIIILGLLALCFHSASAHTYLSSVVLNNGSPLAEGDCVRPHPLGGYDSPIPLLNASDMTCGWLPSAANAANRKCPIAAGQTISLQWHHQSAASGDDIIDPSHNGPIIVYLAKSDTGAGNVWFKIYEDGFANGQWAVQRLLANGGRVDIPLPSDIAPGNYLLRGELLALHGAYALNGVQPYVGCVELTISGSGTKNPAGVAFPGYYTQTDPGMLFSIYQPFTTYIIPGPPLYVSGSSSSSSSSSGSSSGSNTAAPTSTPTTTPKPTPKPPTSPTTKPTDPTSAPATSAPTSPPASGSSSNIKVGLNSGTSEWWVGVVVSGGGETTVKVEMADSGSFSNWVTLTDKSYAYVFEAPSVLKAPLSLRLTSSTGKQVVLTNIFPGLTSNNNLLDSGKSYSSGSSGTSAPTTKPTSAPTSAPTAKPTSAPTSAPTAKPTSTPTSAPTSKPTTGNAKVNIYPDSSQWWFAVTISGTTESISKIELKDAGSRTSYQALTNAGWAYTFNTQGVALVTPLTVKVTTASGKVTYATVSTITPGASLETASQ